jgi:ribulose-5-phosphate 4-epimerase/fuculose-1-phosphate aldolase
VSRRDIPLEFSSNIVRWTVRPTGDTVADRETYKVNRAGFVIHSAIHMARRNLHCALHTHTVPGPAVSALDCGLLPLVGGACAKAYRWSPTARAAR